MPKDLVRIILIFLFAILSVIALVSALGASLLYPLEESIGKLTANAGDSTATLIQRQMLSPFGSAEFITLVIIVLLSSFALSIITLFLLLKNNARYKITGALGLATFFLANFSFIIFDFNLISVFFFATLVLFILAAVGKVKL